MYKYASMYKYLALLSLLPLLGCNVAMNDQVATHANMIVDCTSNVLVSHVIGLVKEGKLYDASKELNMALQEFSENSELHLLNGMIYEKLSESSSQVSNLELAGIAYKRAFELDPSNWRASYHLGIKFYKTRSFSEAQEFLANAIMLRPNDAQIYHDLACASYYAYDISTAASCIDKALELSPNNIGMVRSAAIIYACANQMHAAEKYFKIFKELVGNNDPDIKFVENRINDWTGIHKSAKKPGKHRIKINASDDVDQPNQFIDAIDTKEDVDQVIVFDCCMIRLSTVDTTFVGSNILDKAAVTLGLRGLSGNSVTVNQGESMSFAKTKTFTGPTVTWDSISYGLRIANATRESMRVVAKPTLSTCVGKKATFKSVDQIKGGIAGQLGGSIGEVPYGFTAEILPTKIENDRVTVEISLEGSVLATSDVKYDTSITQQLLRVGQTNVVTTMSLELGTTGMVGGLYLAEDSDTTSGTPVLSSIPILGNLFGRNDTVSTRKSVLFLITPQRASTIRDRVKKYEKRKGANLEALNAIKEKGYIVQDSAIPTIATIIEYLGLVYSREFRRGDVIPTAYSAYDMRVAHTGEEFGKILEKFFFARTF